MTLRVENFQVQYNFLSLNDKTVFLLADKTTKMTNLQQNDENAKCSMLMTVQFKGTCSIYIYVWYIAQDMEQTIKLIMINS